MASLLDCPCRWLKTQDVGLVEGPQPEGLLELLFQTGSEAGKSLTLQTTNVTLNRLFAMAWRRHRPWLQGPRCQRTKEPKRPRLAGVGRVNPGVELCKSFGMLVDGGGGRGRQKIG